MGYALQIGRRYLRSRKRATISVITVVAVCGVALGVAALLAVMSITTGFQEQFRDKVLGVNAHVIVLKYGVDFSEYRQVVEQAEALPEVAGAAPFIIHEMMIARGRRVTRVLVKGVEPERLGTVLDLPSQMIHGSLKGLRVPNSLPPLSPKARREREAEGELDEFLRGLDGSAEAPAEAQEEAQPVLANAEAESAPQALPTVAVPSPAEMEAALAELDGLDSLPSDEHEAALIAELELEAGAGSTQKLPGIVLGKALAENLGVGMLDEVAIISPLAGLDATLWRAGGSSSRSRTFRVVGIFHAGFQEYDSQLVYVDLHQAQAFFDEGDTVRGVELRLHQLEKAPAVARRIEEALGGGAYHTMDWEQLNHNLFTALRIQKIILSIVISVIIVVAAFGVIATLIMIVLDKKREIAILKAMGATDRSILGIFMVQGAVIGVFGTVIGLILGGGVCAYLDAYPFPLDPKVYLIDQLPVRFSLTELVATAVISILICLGATVVPSWWAARLLPTEGLRYQ